VIYLLLDKLHRSLWEPASIRAGHLCGRQSAPAAVALFAMRGLDPRIPPLGT